MSHVLICSWLGLPADHWPPDHYTLLGLRPGESDVRLIEDRVHERLLRLRPYQLHHPEQVTEAMNRLARAFSCLTNARLREAYDRARSAPATVASEGADGSVDTLDPLAWLFGPWNQLGTAEVMRSRPAPVPAVRSRAAPVQGDWTTAPPPPRATAPASSSESAAETLAGVPSAAQPPTSAQPADSLVEAAHALPAARRGLGTRAGLYRRAIATRRLSATWEKLGPFLGRPEWRLTRSRESARFIRMLRELREGLERFPPLLGEAGQPGFWVASLARQQVIVPIFRKLQPAQRQTVARDWRDGRRVLHAHRRFLRTECRELRGLDRLARLRRALGDMVGRHPMLWLGALLLGAALLALALGWSLLASLFSR